MPPKKKLLLIICGILLPVIVVGAYVLIQPKKDSTITSITAAMIVPHLRDGDVILRMSNGALSETFSNFSLTDNRFSHLGIVRIYNDNISIINSLGFITNRERGVEETPLYDFLKVALSIGVFRIQSVEGSIISDKAIGYLGYPFDWSFDLNDGSKIYCTELLYLVLKQVNSEHILSTRYLEQINREIIPLDSISNSPYIDEILYIARNGNDAQ